MRITYCCGLLLILLAIAIAGCSGGTTVQQLPSNVDTTAPATESQVYFNVEPLNPDRATSEFTLDVLDESYVYGSSAAAESLIVDDSGEFVIA